MQVETAVQVLADLIQKQYVPYLFIVIATHVDGLTVPVRVPVCSAADTIAPNVKQDVQTPGRKDNIVRGFLVDQKCEHAGLPATVLRRGQVGWYGLVA